MLNEDKIKLMTGIAMFEKKEGKNIFPVNHYFKGDYISSHLFKSFFSYTICYMLCVLLWGLYTVENLLNTMNTNDLILIAKQMTIIYLSNLVIYLVITYVVYARRYDYANRSKKIYVAKLKRLDKRYEFQNTAKELAKEGKGGRSR